MGISDGLISDRPDGMPDNITQIGGQGHVQGVVVSHLDRSRISGDRFGQTHVFVDQPGLLVNC